MSAVTAASYDNVLVAASRNVWTAYNAGGDLKALLKTWKNGTFSLDNAGKVLPSVVLLWDVVVLETVDTLPSVTDLDDYSPSRVIRAIQKTTYAFRDNPAIDASVQANFVAAFNAVWGP